jgi:hypothetical protein
MNTRSLTGNDTIQIAGRVLTDFAEGDIAKLSFPNELVAVKNGKNGNSIFNLNAMGQIGDLDLRIIRGTADDAFLNGLLVLMTQDLPTFVLMAGYFVKRVGDGTGAVASDTYILSGGVFTKKVEVSENVEGGTEPAVAVYHLRFSNTDRAQF